MLLEITTTPPPDALWPATDLGFLLHKNPARPQSFELSFGQAHVFYSETNPDRCTAALLLDVDPVGLVRGRGQSDGWLDQYVNDRPYAASSFMSVALARLLREAMSGRSKERQALADTAIPLTARIAALPCRGGEAFVRRLFEPLGYRVTALHHALDQRFPSWGEGPYFTVTLEATARLSSLLTHLYVLIPVMDGDKHYWVGEEEVEKLVRFGEGWLEAHPEREEIVKRSLKHRRDLERAANVQLTARLMNDEPDPDKLEAAHDREEVVIERNTSLNEQRINVVAAALRSSGAKRVLDLGCGEGKLIRALLADRQFEQILGMDVSYRSLETAAKRLDLERMPERQRARVTLMQGSLTYRDKRLAGFDAAALVEVIEHLDPPRLASLERVVFEFARPGTVIVTTPNAEFNATWETLPAGQFRHKDHRFEWSRAEFQTWARGIARRFGYTVEFVGIGVEDSALGSPTQMGVFSAESASGLLSEGSS